jgi:hypothetical protein
MNMTLADWIGVLGVSMILLAFYLNSNGKVRSNDLSFILLNLIGATLACLASVLIDYIPFVILEAVWALVSLNSLMKYLKKTKIDQ